MIEFSGCATLPEHCRFPVMMLLKICVAAVLLLTVRLTADHVVDDYRHSRVVVNIETVANPVARTYRAGRAD